MEKTIIQISKDYACHCHWQVNHFYNNKPYSFHLGMVYQYGKSYIDLIDEDMKEDVLAACWTHDLIEDCRQTYNDVKNNTNERVADITYALTNEKGKTRKDRANDKYYEGIRNTPGAVFVKLCDRLANAKYSFDTNSTMLDAYKKEHSDFVIRMTTYKEVDRNVNPYYKIMFEELNYIIYHE